MKIPLRVKLTTVYGAAFMLVTALLSLGTYGAVRVAVNAMADQEIDSRLAGVEDHLARHLDRMPWESLRESLRAHPAFQPALLRIAEANGTLRFEGALLGEVLGPDGPPVATRDTLRHPGGRVRVRLARREILNTSYDLVVGADLSLADAILDRLLRVLVLGLPAAMLLASLAGYWISGRALAPVTEIIAAARAIDATRLSDRVQVSRTGDEIEQLADTTNGMLDRIEMGVQQVRQFTADASHELRTPVALIRATAEITLLNRFAGEEGCREGLRRVQSEAERASRLLDDLLYLAREDAGAAIRPQGAVRLDGSVADACADIGPSAAARHVTVTLGKGDDVWVKGNRDELRRLCTILLDNAVKYTPNGGDIHADVLHGADGSAKVVVTDTGIGIDAEHLPRIFDRFYRVDKARSRAGGGAGLGLAIAQRIARRHGGVIDVTSIPERGSTFTVTLPARDAIDTSQAS